MPKRVSAGLVIYRLRDGRCEVFLAHPGGPLFAHKDDGHWTIPKGEIEPGEDLLAAALREFQEETGINVDPTAAFIPLGFIQQKGGKVVHAWAAEQNWDDSQGIHSNLFTMEWPLGSGTTHEFPEVDRARFFPVDEAKRKLKPTQVPLIERLTEALRRGREE
jgi:predicted NUDIX family NTP pyrophosphohydrolase